MSTQVFPTLIGLQWKRIRTPNFENIDQEAVSGLETRIALRPYPKYQWKMDYSYLGSGGLNGVSNTDYQTMAGFYNARLASYDSFLLTEPDDSAVTGQQIAIGDGATLTFQLLRTFGGFSEPVLAPNSVTAVYVDGTPVSGSFWSVSNWSAAASNGGTGNPGVLTFSAGHAPTSGKAITVDMTYYWPVKFEADKIDFSNEFNKVWALSGLTLKQVYN